MSFLLRESGSFAFIGSFIDQKLSMRRATSMTQIQILLAVLNPHTSHVHSVLRPVSHNLGLCHIHFQSDPETSVKFVDHSPSSIAEEDNRISSVKRRLISLLSSTIIPSFSQTPSNCLNSSLFCRLVQPCKYIGNFLVYRQLSPNAL